MSAIIAGLLSIGYSMLLKLVGYELVTKTVVIGLRAWAKTTANHNDDDVIEAIAKAWGVEPQAVKDLGA